MDNSITILGQIITFLLGMFSIFIVFYFLSHFQRTFYYKKWVYVIGFLVYTVVLLASKNFFGEPITLVTTIVLTALTGHLLYNNKKIYILYYSLYVVCVVVFQIVIMSLFNFSCNTLRISFYSNETYIIAASIVAQISNLAATRFFIIMYRNKNINKITKAQYFNFLVLPVFSIFYIITLMMYVQAYLSIQDIFLILANIVSIIILNLFITNVFESISRNNELKSELKLYEQQSTMQYKYYSDLEDKYASSRKVIHDMKNHLQTIERLYEINNNEKAKEYTEDLYKMFDNLGQRFYTNNRVLNIIVNDKVESAAKSGATLECKIGDVNLDFIKDIDLTIMFSNLLDNAIEAVKDKSEEGNILLKVNNFNDFVVINITNNMGKSPIEDSKGFKTTKESHSGIGLQNVKMTLEKYEGNMRIDYDDKVFKVNIVIPAY